MTRVIGNTRDVQTACSRKHRLHVVRAARGEGCRIKEYWGVRHPGTDEIFVPKEQIQDLIELLSRALHTL